MSIQDLTSIHTVDVYERGFDRGAAGGKIAKPVKIDSDRPCLCDRWKERDARAHRRRGVDKEGVETLWKVYFANNPKVNQRHYFVFVDSGGISHKLWVQSVVNPLNLDRYWLVECLEQAAIDNRPGQE